MDHHGLDVFAVARGRDIGLDGFRRRKPDPHYLQEALGTLGVTAGLYVGDRQTDVEAAQAAGLSAVYLRREHNRDRTLRVTPDATVESLAELHTLIAPPG
jgi:phosphoglycolate phosphatase-like HAD superfamily hydrolase